MILIANYCRLHLKEGGGDQKGVKKRPLNNNGLLFSPLSKKQGFWESITVCLISSQQEIQDNALLTTRENGEKQQFLFSQVKTVHDKHSYLLSISLRTFRHCGTNYELFTWNSLSALEDCAEARLQTLRFCVIRCSFHWQSCHMTPRIYFLPPSMRFGNISDYNV